MCVVSYVTFVYMWFDMVDANQNALPKDKNVLEGHISSGLLGDPSTELGLQ